MYLCKTTLLASFLLASLCSVTYASIADYEEDEDIIVLTAANFDQAVAEFKYLLVDFYAPWCSHCKELLPEYIKAAQTLEESGSEIRLAKVDATVEKELAEKYGVQGYPTLKFFREGTPISCKLLSHTADDLLIWLNKKIGSPATRVDSVQAAKDIIEKEEVVAFGFFKDSESSRGAKSYIEAADAVEDVLFVITNNGEVFTEFGVDKDKIVVFKKFDEGRADLDVTDDLTVSDIKSLVDVNRLPLVIEFNENNAPTVFARALRVHFLLFISKDSSRFDKKIKEYRQVAKKFKGQALFIYVDVDPDEHKRIIDFFGLKRSSCPTYRLINLNGNVKYRPDTDEPTVDELVQFLEDALSGKRKPFLMTEELPSDWDSKPVKELVGKNFDEVARDKTKDVFVKFYAPWCQHCKQLAPVWDELGEKYKDRDDIVIAQIDATQNEVDGVKITVFPTLKLFPKDSDEILEFPNVLNKTIDRLSKFLDNRGHLLEEELERAKPDNIKLDGVKKEEL